MLFEGGKLDLGKMLSPTFQLSHAFQLGSRITPASYHFGSVFVGQTVCPQIDANLHESCLFFYESCLLFCSIFYKDLLMEMGICKESINFKRMNTGLPSRKCN
jgi:hypothetical protein